MPPGQTPGLVREGAAIYFAGEQMIREPQQRPASNRAARFCPNDNDLLHPCRSRPGNAYAERARASRSIQPDEPGASAIGAGR